MWHCLHAWRARRNLIPEGVGAVRPTAMSGVSGPSPSRVIRYRSDATTAGARVAMTYSEKSRGVTREILIAAGTLTVLVIVARTAGVGAWISAGLWSFMAIWTLRLGVHLFQSTRRR